MNAIGVFELSGTPESPSVCGVLFFFFPKVISQVCAG